MVGAGLDGVNLATFVGAVRATRRIDCGRLVCPLRRSRRLNAFLASAVIVTRPDVAQQKRT